jgi:hypothetical protein
MEIIIIFRDTEAGQVEIEETRIPLLGFDCRLKDIKTRASDFLTNLVSGFTCGFQCLI